MSRAVLALFLACGLAGCSHATSAGRPGSDASAPASPGNAGCALAKWQAQTAPVIDKRRGPEVVDSDEAEGGDGNKPCP